MLGSAGWACCTAGRPCRFRAKLAGDGVWAEAGERRSEGRRFSPGVSFGWSRFYFPREKYRFVTLSCGTEEADS